MRKLSGTWHLVSELTWLTDRMHLPELCRVLAGCKPGHLTLIFFAWRLPAHHQHALAVLEQVRILRRLVAGAGPNGMFFPMSFLAFGVLVPIRRFAGKANDDLIRPTVAVDVIRPTEHTFAIA